MLSFFVKLRNFFAIKVQEIFISSALFFHKQKKTWRGIQVFNVYLYTSWLFICLTILTILNTIWAHASFNVMPLRNELSAVITAANDLQHLDPEAIKQIQNQNWFGLYKEMPKKIISPETVPVETKLKIILRGIAFGGNRIAVIENEGRQSSYSQGEKIDGSDAMVDKILNDKILIIHRGIHEYLTLPDAELNVASSVSVSESMQLNDSQTKPETGSGVDNVSVEKQAVISPELLVEIRKEIQSDPKKIMKYIRLSPVSTDGHLKGFLLSPGVKSSLFNASGLKASDVAIALNGQDFTDINQAFNLMMQLSNQASVSLTVLRNGVRHEINIALQP